MITIKSPREIDAMAHAGAVVAGTLRLMRDTVRPGLSTEDLDRTAEEFIRSHPGCRPSFKGLYGFPKTLCTSINEEIVHGIPSKRRVLREGNVVSVDVGVCYDGLHADSATTIPVGEISPDAQRLLEVTLQCLTAGIAQARTGNHVGDIGHAVQTIAEAAGFGVVRELVGHGIGTSFHEEPQIPNYGQPGRREKLVNGMTIAIEPMITLGRSGHPDPARQVDRGNRRRHPLGPLRAHRGDHEGRAKDTDRKNPEPRASTLPLPAFRLPLPVSPHHPPHPLVHRRIPGQHCPVFDAQVPAREVRHQASRLPHQEHPGGDVPRRQVVFPESFVGARGHQGQVQRRGADPADAAGPFGHETHLREIPVQGGQVAEGEPGADQAVAGVGDR